MALRSERREHTPTCSLHIVLMVKPLRCLDRNPGMRYIQSFRLETCNNEMYERRYHEQNQKVTYDSFADAQLAWIPFTT